MCSFVYGSSKTKTKQVASPKDENSEPKSQPQTQTQTHSQHDGNKLGTPTHNSQATAQNYSLNARAIWPGDLKTTHGRTGIDLTRG